MRWIQRILICLVLLFMFPSSVFAASTNPYVSNFVSQTLNSLLLIASLATVFFIIKGGYGYITSTGRPEALEDAKKTIRNAVIGLVLILGAVVINSLLINAFNTPSTNSTTSQLTLTPIETVKPADGLTQVLIDAIFGFLQNIIQSATKPLVDGIISFLTTTPALASNSVIFNFWLVIVGITDSLFVLMIALLGFHFMSASTFGFEEIEFKHLLPRIGLSFLGANISIFLADWIVAGNNVLVNAVLNATGGLTHAWVLSAFDPSSITNGTTPLITLIFMILFVVLSIVLLLFYISRLIIIALGAVVSPLIFLLWLFPKTSDFAEISIKTYFVTIYTVFVHVVIIQLASSFLTVTSQSGANPLISILVAIGLFFTLLKIPGTLMQMVFYSSGRGIIKKVGGQIINVFSSNASSATAKTAEKVVKTPRKVVAA